MAMERLISLLRQIDQEVPNKDDLVNEVRIILRQDFPQFLDTPADKPFTVWWKDGRRSVIWGPTIEAAFTRAGYGAGALGAVDWYDRGDVDTHEWCADTKGWMRKQQ